MNTIRLSRREEELFHKATIGGLHVEDAFFQVYRPRTRKAGLTTLRRKQKLNPEPFKLIVAYKRDQEKRLEDFKAEELLEKAKGEIATELEIDAVLSRIVLGTFKRKRKIYAYDRRNQRFVTAEIKEEPTCRDIISAADRLYKRKGSYPPKNVQVRMEDGFIEFMKELTSKVGFERESLHNSKHKKDGKQ